MPQLIPLVLIPGQLCTGKIWQNQIDALADISTTSIADQHTTDTVSQIAELILKTAPDKFALAGHAMGGFIAFEVMRQAPDRVVGLALLDTIAAADTPAQIERRMGYAKLVQEGHFGDVIEQRYDLVLHPDRTGEPALRAAVKQMAMETGAEAFLRQQNIIITRPDSRIDMHEITCPTLVLMGRQDALSSLETHQEIANAIRNATLEVIEDCGHFSTLEKPKEVNNLLRQWLLSLSLS